MSVLFIDTGFHFPETLAFRDRITEELGLNVKTVRSQIEHSAFLHRYGDLYRGDPDLCCHINKVEPLKRALEGFTAWLTGIRRDQTESRRNTPVVSRDRAGRLKIVPLAGWTQADIWRYIRRYRLPEHPLMSKGYPSIGCAPCTRPVEAGEDERTGRWSGQEKTECGLHSDDRRKLRFQNG